MRQFRTPTRVWVNAPSRNNELHDLHGKVGIIVTITNSSGYNITELHFTEGSVHSMVIPDRLLMYLSTKNSNLNVFGYSKK